LTGISDEYQYETIEIDNHSSSDEYWETLARKALLLNRSGINVRVVAADFVPKWFMTQIRTSPFNIIQFNVNLLDGFNSEMLKQSIAYATGCGLYTVVIFHPIIPTVTKSHEILRFVLSFIDCNAIGIGFLDTNKWKSNGDKIEVGGVSFNKEYSEVVNGRLMCNEEFKGEFFSIINGFLSHRKIDCFVYGGD
jgi:hypothetical protein